MAAELAALRPLSSISGAEHLREPQNHTDIEG